MKNHEICDVTINCIWASEVINRYSISLFDEFIGAHDHRKQPSH